MNCPDIVRAWKDEEYRTGLTEAECAALPQNPDEGLRHCIASDSKWAGLVTT